MMGKPLNAAFHLVSHGMKSSSSMLFKKVSKSLTFEGRGMQTNAIIARKGSAVSCETRR